MIVNVKLCSDKSVNITVSYLDIRQGSGNKQT